MEVRPEEKPTDEFVERFAAVMVASGMPRMASRVFALLLSRDDGSATSAELATALRASPAAISGAVRYLIQLHLVTRAHLPGERRDVYRLLSDDWYEMVGHREHELQQWAKLSRKGVDVVGANTRAGRRLEETPGSSSSWSMRYRGSWNVGVMKLAPADADRFTGLPERAVGPAGSQLRRG